VEETRAGARHNNRERFRGLSYSKQSRFPHKVKLHAVHKITGERFPIVAPVLRHARLKRRVKAWSWSLNEFMQSAAKSRARLVMITLTYREGVEWQPQHMRQFMQHFLKSEKHIKMLGYAWVAELQKRGAVHFHVLLLVRHGSDIPLPDKIGWWPHGSSKIETARSHWYIVKYASKALFLGADGEWKKYPKGIRIFAVWVAPGILDSVQRWNFRLSSQPGWIRDLLENVFPMAEWERPTFGGWRVWPPGDMPFLTETPYFIDGLKSR